MITPLLSAIAFFIGIFVQTFTDLGWSSWFVFCGGAVLFVRPKLAVILIAITIGLWRVHSYEENIVKGIPFETYVSLEGEIVEEIDRRVKSQKITVMTEYGRVLANISPYMKVSFGDTVRISGELQQPSDDLEGFNYAKYLARFRVWSVIYDAKVMQLERAPPSIRGYLYGFKSKMESSLNRLYFEPEASFAAGLLLGSRKGMPTELASAFQKVGLTHIVAISGYNISLVIAAMFLILSFLPLKVRVIVSTIAIVLFVLLVGASAAVVRAGIMGSLTLWGLFSGRKSQAFFGLIWSAVLMVIMNPYTLVYDAGFQLSFASTLGLLIYYPILDEKIPQWSGFGVVREAFLLTLAAQVMTVPLIMFQFGRISLISPLANLFAAPFLSFAMLFSALSLVFGKTLALVAWFHLRMVELVAIWFAKVPYADFPATVSFAGFITMNLLILGFAMVFYKPILIRSFGLQSLEASLRARVRAVKKRVKQYMYRI